MANEEHVAILRQGEEQGSRWRKNHPHIEPDLRAATRHRPYGIILACSRRSQLMQISHATLRGICPEERNHGLPCLVPTGYGCGAARD
jgi:hypothetical protein